MARISSLVLAVLLSAGCSEGSAPPTTPAEAAAPSEDVTASEAASSVASIVFIGQKDACDCTHARVDTSWSALEAALDGHDIPVERIDLDVDEARTRQLQALERFIAAPAIYFFDADGGLVEMLQGEVSEEHYLEVLDR